MLKKFHLSRVLRAQVSGRLITPFRRRVFMALVLALTLLGTGQTPLAQAAPDNSADVKFEIEASPSAPKPLCINEPLKIYVSVNKLIHKTVNNTDYDLPRGFVTGVKVRGSVTKGNEVLTPSDITIGEELGALAPGDADFLFTAKKPAKATITFNADVPVSWTGSAGSFASGEMVKAKKAEIQVTVRNCKFKVKTISRWSAGMTIVSTIDDAVMKADDQGTFTGSATVNWVASVIGTAGCGAESTIAPSKATLTGTIDDSDQLVGKVTFEPMSASGIANCGPVSESTGNFGTPDPLTINLTSSGGMARQAQVFTAKNGSFTGSSIIIITPEDGGATAFNPGSQGVLEGSLFPSGLIGWKGFPGLFSTLLATN